VSVFSAIQQSAVILQHVLAWFVFVADFSEVTFAEDRGVVRVVFELEEVVRGIFEEKRQVLDLCAGVPAAGLLVELQSFGLGPIRERLPAFLRREDQPEMAWINPLLAFQLL